MASDRQLPSAAMASFSTPAQSRAEAPAFDGDEIRGDPCLRLDFAGTEAQTSGDFRVTDKPPPRSREIVVSGDGNGWLGVVG